MRILPRTIVAVAMTITSMNRSAAGAQTLAPVAARYAAPAGSETLRQSTIISGNESAYDETSRIALGLVGGFGGAFAGGAIGAQSAAGCHGEFCGFGNVLAGVAIGSVAMATFLSVAPSLGSKCTITGRALRAFGGSVTGAVAGGVVGLLGGPLTVLTYIVGSGIGAGVGAALC
jgi:hypothetical protein